MPRLSILATSRERLGITGEVLRALSGLTVPELGASGASEVGGADAARLLVERAAAVRPGFRLDDATATAAAQICQRLDGLPLAIELAAARVNGLGLEQIVARLDDRFRLLNRGDRMALARHQTLRAVVDWSYGLLSVAERRLFDHLAVFIGGFTLEAAEAVCNSPADVHKAAVASLIGRLVDKSLILSEGTVAANRRYRMLETLREYGLERLNERHETAALRDAHAAYFLSFAEPAGVALRGPEQPTWLNRLEIEHGNLRAALEWSLEQGDGETAVRLAGSLYPFWDLHGHYSEGRRWLTRVLTVELGIPTAARARALLGSATLAVIQGDLQHAAAACEQAAELCQQAGDPAGLAHALQYLGLGAIFADELDSADELLKESLRNARTADDKWLEEWALAFLGAAALARGEPEKAMELAAECEALSRPTGDPECLAWALLIGGIAAWYRGDHAGAAGPLLEALRAFQRLNALWGLSLALFISAQSAGARADYHDLAVLLGASERLRLSVGAALVPFIERWLDSTVAHARIVLGADAFDRAWTAGQALPLTAAVRQALREFDPAA